LYVIRRIGDYLQDVGRCSLPLQRLTRFVEQPGVLDRDHRLVGEGLRDVDFALGEGPWFLAAEYHRTLDPVLSDQWHGKNSSWGEPGGGERLHGYPVVRVDCFASLQ